MGRSQFLHSLLLCLVATRLCTCTVTLAAVSETARWVVEKNLDPRVSATGESHATSVLVFASLPRGALYENSTHSRRDTQSDTIDFELTLNFDEWETFQSLVDIEHKAVIAEGRRLPRTTFHTETTSERDERRAYAQSRHRHSSGLRRVGGFPSGYPSEPLFESTVRPLLPLLSESELESIIQVFSENWNDRAESGDNAKPASDWVRDRATSIVTDASRTDVLVLASNLTRTVQQSIRVIVPAVANSTVGSEIIIIGSHLDTVRNSPGADDNASGVAICLEVLRVLLSSSVSLELKRSVEFHFYAAEEVGLAGSSSLAQEYDARDAQVSAMLQLDMDAYQDSSLETPAIGVISDAFTSAALSNFVVLMSNTYSEIGGGLTSCGYACSDHASWHRRSFPATYVTENLSLNNPHYHTSEDTIDYLNMTHCRQIAMMTLGFALELSLNGPNPPPEPVVSSALAGASPSITYTLVCLIVALAPVLVLE